MTSSLLAVEPDREKNASSGGGGGGSRRGGGDDSEGPTWKDMTTLFLMTVPLVTLWMLGVHHYYANDLGYCNLLYEEYKDNQDVHVTCSESPLYPYYGLLFIYEKVAGIS